MSKENFRTSSTSWVGSFYRHLEHICSEVDDVVRQGTARYVGDRVKTVSENVKKFCSDAVKDLLHDPSKFPAADAEAGPSHHDSVLFDDVYEECPLTIDAEKVPRQSHSHPNYDLKDETEECPPAVDDEQFSCKGDAIHVSDDYAGCESNASSYHLEEEPSTLPIVDVITMSTGVPLCQEEGTLRGDDVEQSIELKGSHSDDAPELEYLGEEKCLASSSSDGSIIQDASFKGYSPLLSNDQEQETMHKTTSTEDSDATSTSPTTQHVTSVPSCEGSILETFPMSLTPFELLKDSATSPTNLFAEGEKCDELVNIDGQVLVTRMEKRCNRDAVDFSDGSSTSLAPVTCVISRECEAPDVDLAFASADFLRMPKVLPANLVIRGECCELDHLVEHKFPAELEEMSDGDFNNVFDDSSGLSCSQRALSVTSCESITDAESACSVNADLPKLSGNDESSPVNLPQKEEENCFGIAYMKESYAYFPISLDSADVSPSGSSSTEPCGEMDDQSMKTEDPKMQISKLPKKIRFNGLGLLGANTIHYALRRREKNLGFYKKKLQHALTSRKRTEKEYRQLAIWYGDIEADLDELTDLSLLQSVATIPVSNDSATKSMQDSEWELV
ncbi:hypothetical protein AKJ16_DCAP14745 [Drosera capensis]